jgi:hypothetical protein
MLKPLFELSLLAGLAPLLAATAAAMAVSIVLH